MRLLYPLPTRWLPLAMFLTTVITLSGCALQRISYYDQAMDDALTALQKKTEQHLVTLEAVAGTPTCTYENHKIFYSETKVDLSALSVRAAAIPSNEITSEQLGLLTQMFASLEQLHQLACISPAQIQPLRIQLNTGFTAILRLELAKRRDN